MFHMKLIAILLDQVSSWSYMDNPFWTFHTSHTWDLLVVQSVRGDSLSLFLLPCFDTFLGPTGHYVSSETNLKKRPHVRWNI